MPDTTRPLAVALISGGMDSAVAAAEAARDWRLAALHLSYGQRTAARERACFEALADHLNAERRLALEVGHLAAIGGSALTDRTLSVPEADLGRVGVPVTYVPFRNAHLLATAVSWAEVIGATAVVIGAVEEDSSGYPDCRRVFFEAFSTAVATGTRPGSAIRLLTPVLNLDKAAIVRRGVALGVPFERTWSCYAQGDAACGQCDSCALRRRGFARAGVEDPIPYTPAA
jgi:7-cyano-7-deazaguanine synthase